MHGTGKLLGRKDNGASYTHVHTHTGTHGHTLARTVTAVAHCTWPPLGLLLTTLGQGTQWDAKMQWAQWICFQHRGQRTQLTIIHWGGRSHNQPSLMGVKCTCPGGSAPNRLSDWGELICN